MKIALHLAAEGGCDYKLMVMDVKCAFLYGKMRRNIYIELPPQDERYGDKNLVGKLVKAMYGTRDAPQIWGDLVQETMTSLGMQSSMIQPSVYFHVSKKLVVVTHVDDFLCVGPEENLTWLFEGLSAKFEMTKTIVGQGHAHEVEPLHLVEQRCIHDRGRHEAQEHFDEGVGNGAVQWCRHSSDP